MKNIPLTRGQHAIVDDQDFEQLSAWKWHVTAHGYAARSIRKPDGKQTTVFMHRQILETPAYLDTDHVNANKLDNQRSNLRVCTASQNGGNRVPAKGHKFKGVTWAARDKKWRASIVHGKRRVNLGKHATAKLAAEAYNVAASKLFGEFARLNVVPGESAKT